MRGLVTAEGSKPMVRYSLAVSDGLKVTATALELTHPSGIRVTIPLT